MRRMFSEKQIKKLVEESPVEIKEALKGQDLEINGLTSKGIANTGVLANIGNVAISGDLVAKTLSQSEANWSVDITSFPNLTEATVSTPIFCRVQQMNQELHIVFIGKIENNTENAISGYSLSEVEIDLPEEIASKIYDMTGAKASELNSARISANYAYVSTNASIDVSGLQNNIVFIVSNKSVRNRIGVRFSRASLMSIAAGSTWYFEGRVFLDLL